MDFPEAKKGFPPRPAVAAGLTFSRSEGGFTILPVRWF